MAVTNISCVQNTGPAFWRQDSNSSKDRILDRNSWDLQQEQLQTIHYNNSKITTGYNITFLTLQTEERIFKNKQCSLFMEVACKIGELVFPTGHIPGYQIGE